MKSEPRNDSDEIDRYRSTRTARDVDLEPTDVVDPTEPIDPTEPEPSIVEPTEPITPEL